MKKVIVTFGVISGVLSSAMMVATIPFIDKIGFDRGAIVGYTAMVLSFLLVFFGVRSYRDNVASGTITFVTAFGVGIGITLISCVFYVVTWEILYFNFLPDFGDKLAAYSLQQLKSSGASAAAIQQQVEEMKKFNEAYKNPLYNSAVTFLEPLPVGLLMTLIAAFSLRKRKGTLV